MKKKDIQKYFDRRPGVEELFAVGNIVFIKLDEAQSYADQTGSVVETKRHDDPDDEPETTAEETTSVEAVSESESTEETTDEIVTDTEELAECEAEEAEEIELQEGDTIEDIETGDVFELKEGELQEVTEQTPAPDKKKTAPRKNTGK